MSKLNPKKAKFLGKLEKKTGATLCEQHTIETVHFNWVLGDVVVIDGNSYLVEAPATLSLRRYLS